MRRRRDSLGLRKRSRSREKGLNRISAVNIGLEDDENSESAKTKAEFDHRLSLGGKGQLDDQRGLLNKNDLVDNFRHSTFWVHKTFFKILPDFLRETKCPDENFEFGKIPDEEEADAFFGDNFTSLGGSMNSLAFSDTSSCSSLFKDVTNQSAIKTPVLPPKLPPIPAQRKRLQAMSTSSETDPGFLSPAAPVKKQSSAAELRKKESVGELRKRQSLTQADLIDLPSPPKTKRKSPPKATVV